MKSAIAFVKDFEVFSSILRELKRYNLNLKSVSTADDAIEAAKEEDNPLIFLDLRSIHVDPEVDGLIKRLAENEIEGVSVVVISGRHIPKWCAAEADLIASCFVQFRSNGELVELRGGSLHLVISGESRKTIPVIHRLEGTDVNLQTREPKFFQAIDDIRRIAHRNVTILIVGETGTGKTTLARIIHERSPRRDRPFQNLACGALPSDIIESELFGHTRGAFTGADRNKMGRFQAAGQGTLLLDEIDVLDVKQQAKLLKVIETGEYEMVGSTEPRRAEARLIVASNVNLEVMAEASKFRSDLYYRLSVLEFRLLPLRERVDDIIPLAMQFVHECCLEHEIEIDSVDFDFLDVLRDYHWPGNIRELKNHIRRAVLFCENGKLTVNDLSPKLVQSQFEPSPIAMELKQKTSLAEQVAQNERELLVQALNANDNNRTKTAKALGISRVGLYKKLRKHGLVETQTTEVG
ncbi:sigma 54-interacting transcriptional regulator [Thalassoglobus sp.]|uniref:sigma 54-interacting transcriptional regulator n=1 Tax=Thalassoglobus sp. TaxID=2795869 RepID=UPI003AA7F55A